MNETNIETASLNITPASIGARFLAFIIDSLVNVLLTYIPSALLKLIYGLSDEIINKSLLKGSFTEVDPLTMAYFVQVFVLDLLLSYLYYAIGYKYYATTIGKNILGLKVQTLDGSNPSFLKTFIRETFGKSLSMILFGAGHIMAIFNKQNRTLYDYMAKTIVVRSSKNRPFQNEQRAE